MDKVEKEIEEILKGVAGRVYCVICSGYDFECGCEIDVNQRNIHNATIEITAVMKAENESWQIICKDKKTKIDKLQADLAEAKEDLKPYMLELGKTQRENNDLHKETKRLRKIVTKHKENHSSIDNNCKGKCVCRLCLLIRELEQSLNC